MTDYTLKYLENLIENQIEESLHLEYKASGALGKEDKKKIEISKDISAMANSDGGVIIYGISEDPDRKYLPKELDPINRKEFSKEWLEQIIQDNIQPRICDIYIYPISVGNDMVVYVVDVPKSNTAHQSLDKRYYKRFNFNSVPMYDYEIRDVFNRTKNPEIELKFVCKSNKLTVHAFNKGAVYAKYVNVKLRLPSKIVKNARKYQMVDMDMVEISGSNAVKEIVSYYDTVVRYWPTRYEPVLPKTSFRLCEIELYNYPFDYENIMEWDIFCDNSNPTKGSIRLEELLKS